MVWYIKNNIKNEGHYQIFPVTHFVFSFDYGILGESEN